MAYFVKIPEIYGAIFLSPEKRK